MRCVLSKKATERFEVIAVVSEKNVYDQHAACLSCIRRREKLSIETAHSLIRDYGFTSAATLVCLPEYVEPLKGSGLRLGVLGSAP